MKLYSVLLTGASLALVAGCGADTKTASSASSETRITFSEKEVATPAEVIEGYREALARDITEPGVPTNPLPAPLPRPIPGGNNPIVPGPRPLPSPGGPVFPGTGINPQMIVNIAKQVIDIIKENRGVANVQVDYANAIPLGITNVEQLTNFSNLKFKSFELAAKNGFGQEVAKVVYTLVHQYNGNYQGVGQYLSTVSVIPSKINVAWGYRVDFKTSHIQTYLSDRSTEGNPVAGLIMELQLDLINWLGQDHQTKIFEFHGDSPTVVSISP